jgi:hypothetical protein
MRIIYCEGATGWSPLFKEKNMPTRSNKNFPHDTRQIRVFISSTFRDMMEERDVLVKFIFPQLRRLCESRGVTWGEVDLRWGVTDEAAAEGKVLPICLEEINRCRPYFIGLLGERYGWVPENIPDELMEKEPWLKGAVQRKEVCHGTGNSARRLTQSPHGRPCVLLFP